MRIEEIMTKNVRSCGPGDDLGAASCLMWDGDCGIIPVVDTNQRPVGVITDRDICIAVATKGRRADQITVGEVLAEKSSEGPYTCRSTDDVRQALQTMKHYKIRRLPVLDRDGILVGVLSMNDIVMSATELKTKGKKGEGVSYSEVVETLRSICSHQQEAVAA